MVLKSYRFRDKTKRKTKPAPKLKSTSNIIKGGVTAILGVALLSQVAGAVRRI